MSCYTATPGDGTQPAPDPVSFSTTKMHGSWTDHAYKLSHDGAWVLVHHFDGFELIHGNDRKTYKVSIRERELFWGPDSRRFCFWAPEGLAVCNVDDPGEPDGPLRYKVVYTDPPGRTHFGVEWSPDGADLFVIENYEEEPVKGIVKCGSAVKRIPVGGGSAREILKHPKPVDFFMPPVSRFQNGSGASNRPYRLVFGARDGLFLMDRDGKGKDRLTEVPAVGLQNLEWSPGAKDKICLFFRTPQPDARGQILRGVYLVHIDRLSKPEVEADRSLLFEQLYNGLDAHTLWFSPKGKYVTWSTPELVAFREPDAPAKSAVTIEIKDERGLFAQVKGCAWDAKETRLAITADNRLYVHDVAKKTTTLVSKFGAEGKAFAAEPAWRGEEIVLTVFTDTTGTRKKNAPTIKR